MLISAALLFLLFAISSILGINLALLLPFIFKNKKVMKLDTMLKTWFRKETSAGYLLLICALFSFFVANTAWGSRFSTIWNHPLNGHPISDWINDGLMAVFFLLVGLELKQELLYGTLNSFRQALLPAAAALGGMLVPILVYLGFNAGTPTGNGFGIPMATDIAFALAVLAVLGDKVPASLKIFLIALAVIDDIGAILVIALCYTSGFRPVFALAALLVFGMLFLLGHSIRPASSKGERRLIVFLLSGGVLLWWLLSESGIHPSIGGVLSAVTFPSRGGKTTAPANRLRKRLHHPVYYLILPLFVLANTAVPLRDILPAEGFSFSLFAQNHTLGILTGLLLGKPVGILLGSYMVLYAGLAELPQGMHFRQLVGIGFLGGIGFTMALFIAALSFTDAEILGTAKLSVFLASLIAAIIGAALIRPRKGNRSACGRGPLPSR